MSASSEQTNFDFVNRVAGKLDDKVEASGVDSLTADERVVYFIWGALGIIGNGSFQYFFENDLDAEATAQSYQELGLSVTAECFRLAQSLLPAEYEDAEWKRQLELLQEREASLDALAKKVLADTKDTEDRLAKHILTHPNLTQLANE